MRSTGTKLKVTELLSFVALYGMLLMPMGAVVFVDFWLFRRLGLQENYAARRGIAFNWAAGLTWFVTLGVCAALVRYANIEIFFVSLPGWFVAAALYPVLSRLFHKAPADAN